MRACSCWGRFVAVSGSPVAGWLPGASKVCSLKLAKHVTQYLELVNPACCKLHPILSLLYTLRARPRTPCLNHLPAPAMGWSVRTGSAGPQLPLPQLLQCCSPWVLEATYLKALLSYRIDLTHILPFRGRLRGMRSNEECMTSLRGPYGHGVLGSFMLT